jgi:hypothetical protein
VAVVDDPSLGRGLSVLAVETEALWYLTRGTGIVSIVLLTVVAVLGIAQVQQWVAAGWPQFVVAGLHRNASLVAVSFIGIHIVSTVVDGFAPITWLDAVVPFGSAYRPIWLGLGALAFDLLLAVLVTSLLRRHLRPGTWRGVHWLAYACWPIAFVHGLGTGSDGATTWVLAIDAVCLAAIVAAIGWRIGAARAVAPGRRVAAASLTLGLVAAIVGWAFAGPASAGWARRAGTPDDLLAAPSTDPSATSTPSSTSSSLPLPFTSQLDATLDEQRRADRTTDLVVDGTLTGDLNGVLHLELTGPSTSSGGLRLQSGQVTIGPASDPNAYTGAVTSLRGSTVTATVSSSQGDQATVTINLQLDQRTDRATGTVTGDHAKSGG